MRYSELAGSPAGLRSRNEKAAAVRLKIEVICAEKRCIQQERP
jgi:hypothetical protein